MERLTFEGNFCDIAQCRELPCKYDGNCSQKQVWEWLKAYEDTGLTPEEIKAPFTEDAMINLAAQALGVVRTGPVQAVWRINSVRREPENRKGGKRWARFLRLIQAISNPAMW